MATLECLCINSIITNNINIGKELSTNDGLKKKLNEEINKMSNKELLDYLYKYYTKNNIKYLFDLIEDEELLVEKVVNYILNWLYCVDYLASDRIRLFEEYFWKIGICITENCINYEDPIYNMGSLKIIFLLMDISKCERCKKIIDEENKYVLHSYNYFDNYRIKNECRECNKSKEFCELEVRGSSNCLTNYLVFGKRCMCIDQKCVDCKRKNRK